PSLGSEQKEDEDQQDQVLGKGFAGRQWDTIPKAAAFPHLPGQVGIAGEKSKEDDQQKEQPAEQPHPPSQQDRHPRNDLEDDHDDGKYQRIIVQPVKIPDLEELLHLIAQAQRVVGFYQSRKNE